jgi:hypothetical protein
MFETLFASFREGLAAQIMSILLVLAPMLWLLAAHYLDQKRLKAA